MEGFFKAGYISRVHGIRGEVKAKFEVEDIFDFEDRASVFLAKQGKPALFHVTAFRIQNDQEAILAFEEVKDRNAAELLRGYSIYIPLAELPQAEEGDFYYHDIIGFRLVDENLGEIGVLKDVYEMPGQDLMALDYQGREALIPMADTILLNIDMEHKTIHTRVPEGLLEVFTNPRYDSEESV